MFNGAFNATATAGHDQQSGKPIGGHALVIGGSVAGLMAARVLSDTHERVTVIDRDELPTGNQPRRTVPQGHHPHGLLVRGQEIIEQFFPGIRDEMIEAGAPTYVPVQDMRFSISGHEVARASGGDISIVASRPFIEGHIRRRVSAIDNIEIRSGCEAQGLIATPDCERVTGVRILTPSGEGEESLEADLVVGATGRSARIPAWLEELGYQRPDESALQVEVAYATRVCRLPEGACPDPMNMIGVRPDLPRMMVLFGQEGGDWLLTIGGYGEHRPPNDPDGFDEFLESVAPPKIMEALRGAELSDEVTTFGFPAERRRHYERMRRFPDGLLVIGDAICSFNPLHGQGMSVAVIEAEALGHCLQKGSRNLRRRYLREAGKAVDQAWMMATGSDLEMPTVEGPRPLSMRLASAYLERLWTRAETDGDVATALMRVGSMFDRPTALFRPWVVRRALVRRAADAYAWPGRQPSVPMRRRPFRVSTISTTICEAGPRDSNEATVFVPGAPGTAAEFEPLVAAAGAVGRAVVWDAPGFGRADKPGGFDHDIEKHGRFLGAALEALRIDRVHLVLHDLGWGSGLSWAADDPGCLASVTLLASGPLLGHRGETAGRSGTARTARRELHRALRGGQGGRLPRTFMPNMLDAYDHDARAAVRQLYRSIGDFEDLAGRFAAVLRPDEIPALAILGSADPCLSPTLAEQQQEAFPGVEVCRIEGCGHWPHIEQGDRVAELLVRFLARSAAGDDKDNRNLWTPR